MLYKAVLIFKIFCATWSSKTTVRIHKNRKLDPVLDPNLPLFFIVHPTVVMNDRSEPGGEDITTELLMLRVA